MDPRLWSREALVAHVAGAQITMRTPSGANLPAPGWLAAAAAVVSDQDSTESLEVTHPDDRATLVASFVDSNEAPGVECTCRIRAHLGDIWFHAEVTWLNLTHQPEVGGLLCTVRFVDGPVIEPPAASDVASVHSATNWMIFVLSETGVVNGVRGSLEGILGYPDDEVIGRMATDFVHRDCLAGAVENWITLRLNPGQTRTSRQMWVRKDGSGVWLETSFLVHDDDQSVEIVILDITDRLADEAALAASQAELSALAADFRLVADEVPMPVFRCDAEGRIEFRNTQWTETFPSQADAQHLHDVLHPDEHIALAQLIASMVDAVGESQVLEARAADGVRILSLRCRTVGDDAAHRRFVGSISDISTTVRLRHEATHDALTGLANRAMISARLAEAIEADAEGTLVLFVDLDGFKGVNDEHGHEAGDVVLVEVARRLTAAVRPGDHVGRYGGDEFVVVCRDVSATGSDALVERVGAEAFDRPIELPHGAWSPAASIGHARPWPGSDVAAVIRRADEAMFATKHRRGDRRAKR